MTAEVPPGWYPDPNGSGQKYWDGQQWQGGAPAPLVPTVGAPSPYGGFGGPAAPKPDTATSLLGLWSLLMGLGALVLDFLCGVGIVFGLVGLGVGLIALNRSKQTNANRGLVIAGIAVNGVALLLGLVLVIFFGTAFTAGFSSSGN